MSRHDEKVQRVRDQLKSVVSHGQGLRFKKRSVSHVVPNPYAKNQAPEIDLAPLCEILEIDEENLICVAESGVTFDELVQATLAKGLMPYTVPELKTITIGGAVSGCSVESKSYYLGGFHDSCLEYELLTGEGEVVTLSPEKDADLFNLIHGAYGTLGILTKLKFKLLPAKPYVKLENRLYTTLEEYTEALEARCKARDYDFIDGIIHGPDSFVLCLGTLVDTVPYYSCYEWMDIYYKSTLTRREDYLRTYEYFFRYDTECHWLTKVVPPLENKLVRLALGKLVLGSTNLITWSNRLKPILKIKKRPEVVVDVFIPWRNFKEFFQWYNEVFDFYPLWIVPYQMQGHYPWMSDEHAARVQETFVIDCAVYGKPNCEPDKDYSELMEKKVMELHGVKTLISRNHYDEETFWSIYAKDRIDAAKARLDPKNLFGGMYERFAPHHYQR